MLLRLGCEKAQGYVIAKPMPPQDMASWIGEWKPSPIWLEVDRTRRDDIQLLFAEVEHRFWINQVLMYFKDEVSVLPTP